ncbi:hypothetical protein PV05_06073 [Exophiala xenobiotica]|uniref:Uncharacterized protein n=1 Tax=Exophiala xenobiotica TaxID=348802 RepID=A0A0D2D5E1_9EURO|nr:uncharacterized protein PV05_06073 [Exophiala xenobiotica]KIW57532.1 hypothetical protein PV05_06073 [Exophiala xenobiotica]
MSAQLAAGPEIVDISSSEAHTEASDDVSESGSSDDAQSTTAHTLEEAIISATASRVKQVLLNICYKNAICRHLASEELLVSTYSSVPATENGGSKKRVRKAFEMCCQCEEEYDVLENEKTKGLCVYHPGYKDLDTEADIWADHDPSCHGNPHDFDDDPDYAEGFKWDCCDEDAITEGCKTSKHRPDPSKRRK